MKYFIDGGGHCGCSRRKFLTENNEEYTILSYEPDPEFNQFCPHLINKALWIENCTKTFYKFALDGGSSLSDKRGELLKIRKPNYYPCTPITVECIDIAELIFSLNPDELILKLDVEGAEYDIIPHLIKTGAINLVSEIYVEWHDIRVGIPTTKTLELKSQLSYYNLFAKEWEASESDKYECIKFVDKSRNYFNART